MILEIKKYGESVLKKKAKEVESVNPEIKELIFNMAETLKRVQGVGLAAPQVGESKRIIIVNDRAFINPEIIKKSRETEVGEEGCLCLPGVYLKIKRLKSLEITAQDLEGKQIEIKSEGLIARVFQHEIDHLNGILILDKIPFWQRWKIKRKLIKLLP